MNLCFGWILLSYSPLVTLAEPRGSDGRGDYFLDTWQMGLEICAKKIIFVIRWVRPSMNSPRLGTTLRLKNPWSWTKGVPSCELLRVCLHFQSSDMYVSPLYPSFLYFSSFISQFTAINIINNNTIHTCCRHSGDCKIWWPQFPREESSYFHQHYRENSVLNSHTSNWLCLPISSWDYYAQFSV